MAKHFLLNYALTVNRLERNPEFLSGQGVLKMNRKENRIETLTTASNAVELTVAIMTKLIGSDISKDAIEDIRDTAATEINNSVNNRG